MEAAYCQACQIHHLLVSAFLVAVIAPKPAVRQNFFQVHHVLLATFGCTPYGTRTPSRYVQMSKHGTTPTIDLLVRDTLTITRQIATR